MRERLLATEKVKAIDWRDARLYLLDQRRLPTEEVWHACESATEVAQAIRDMVVRGASAIGISAAYGLVLGLRARLAEGGDWRAALEVDFDVLAASRPTAANLFWALEQMRERLGRLKPGEAPRPWLQGSRLTAWELAGEEVPVTLGADSAVAHLMKERGITWVVVGADRVAANGDVASKIGTYQLAVLAMHHGVRFMVVASTSSIDMTLETGDDIPLEERAGSELLEVDGRRFAADVEVFNPVFDVTPADLIDAIVTERGVVERPGAAKLAALMSPKRLH